MIGFDPYAAEARRQRQAALMRAAKDPKRNALAVAASSIDPRKVAADPYRDERLTKAEVLGGRS